MNISRRKIKILMGKQGLTGKALAERMNMAPNGLSVILCRESCYPATAVRIANALNVGLEEIIKEE